MERITSGVERLDTMLGGGYYRGSSVLISGSPGTAKTTLATSCASAACDRGERALVMTFDEGASQFVRNLASVHMDLKQHVDSGALVIKSVRTESQGAEEHLLALRALVDQHRPIVLVIDPISALNKTGGHIAASHASVRIMDFAKSRGITTICTSLLATDAPEQEVTATQISTIADTWIHLAYLVKGGERNRTLTIVKSRGTSHSRQVRELLLSKNGISLADVYSAGGEVLVGTARYEREREEQEAERQQVAESKRRKTQLALAEAETSARIAALQCELEAQRAELAAADAGEHARLERRMTGIEDVKVRRIADASRTASKRPRRTDQGNP